jgi:hypothetical protein
MSLMAHLVSASDTRGICTTFRFSGVWDMGAGHIHHSHTYHSLGALLDIIRSYSVNEIILSYPMLRDD